MINSAKSNSLIATISIISFIIGFALSNLVKDYQIVLFPGSYIPEFIFLIIILSLFLSLQTIYSLVYLSRSDALIGNVIFSASFVSGIFSLQFKSLNLYSIILSVLMILLGLISFQRKFVEISSNQIKKEYNHTIKISAKLLIILIATISTLNFYNINQKIPLNKILTPESIDKIIDPSIEVITTAMKIPAEYVAISDVKAVVETQITTYIKPYESYLPLIFALGFYFMIAFILSISRFFAGITIKYLISELIKYGVIKEEIIAIDTKRISF